MRLLDCRNFSRFWYWNIFPSLFAQDKISELDWAELFAARERKKTLIVSNTFTIAESFVVFKKGKNHQ